MKNYVVTVDPYKNDIGSYCLFKGDKAILSGTYKNKTEEEFNQAVNKLAEYYNAIILKEGEVDYTKYSKPIKDIKIKPISDELRKEINKEFDKWIKENKNRNIDFIN